MREKDYNYNILTLEAHLQAKKERPPKIFLVLQEREYNTLSNLLFTLDTLTSNKIKYLKETDAITYINPQQKERFIRDVETERQALKQIQRKLFLQYLHKGSDRYELKRK